MGEKAAVISETNRIANDLASVVYEKEKKALCETLEAFGVPQRLFRIFEEMDESYCLIIRDWKFVTYVIEKGYPRAPEYFETFEEAAEKLMRMFSDNDMEFSDMKDHYYGQVKSASIPATRLFSGMLKSVEKIMRGAAML